MSVPASAATISPFSVAAVLRIGRRRYILTWRPSRRVAPLLVRLLARGLGARAAWGRPAAFLAAMLAGLLAGAPAVAGTLNPNALPTGATVAAGQAAVTQAGSRMDIVQQTGKAILNWDTFNIGSGAAVTFRQPGADAVVLNRVAGNAPSQLLGSLSANGKVWLVNPAGIMVGQGATIDLHGFVASTLAVRDDDFLAGRMLFRAPAGIQPGSVHNHGAIATPTGGSVYLVAPDVQNHGLISAPGGEVLLAAGATVELIDTATPGVRVAVTGTQGSAVNLGQVVSTAGRIGMAGVLVKNSGILNAGSVVSEGGRIFLRAGKDAVVDGHAQVLATGATGGAIEVTGERVGILDAAVLDASGARGGGTVLAGGAFRGGDGVPRAQSAVLAQDAVLRADALARGDGGQVVLWSDGATLARGTVSARGGAQGGNGGLVETSGRQYLDISGLRADTTAQGKTGKTGTLLLDPANLVIGTVADIDGQGNGTDAGSIVADPATGLVKLGAGTYSGTSQVTAASVGALLATTNVALEATSDITVNTQISKSAGGDQSLTLSAGRDIALNQPIVSTSGALALNLGAGGAILGNTFGSQSLNGGVLTASGVNGVSLGNVTAGSVSASSSAGAVSINAPGALTLAGSAGSQYVVTAGGDVTLNGLSAAGDIALNADGHDVIFKSGAYSSGLSQSYRGNLLLAANTTMTSRTTVEFNGALSSMPGLSSALTVNNDSGLATFAGAVGPTALGTLGSLSVSGGVLLKGNVSTTGAQSYGGPLQITANTVLKGGSVTLGKGGTGSAGGAPAALSVQAQDIALAGTLDGFSTVVTGGALAVTSLNLASPWIQNGAVNVAAAGTLSSGGGAKMTGAITLGAGARLILASSAADTINGAIGGDGGVVKTGSGVSTFNGANTYTGDTQADGGILKLAVSNALGGKFSIGSGGTVSLAADTSIAGLFSSAGVLNGTGTLTAAGGYQLDGAAIGANLGAGALTQASGGSLLTGAYGGGTVSVTGGTLAFGAANRLPATAAVTVGDGGALETAGFSQTVKTVASSGSVSASGGGILTATDGFTFTGGTVSGALAGSAVTQTAGAMTWSGTFDGSAIYLLGGAMNIAGGGLQAGAAFLQSASGTALSVAGASSIVNLLNNGTADVNAALALGTGASDNAGVINLNGGAGRLVLNGGTLSNGAAGTVTLAGTHAAPISGTGTFSNAGAFGKPGGGAQTAVLTANTGTVSVGGGTLTLSGLASNAGTITVAGGATLATASGNFTNGVGGVLAGGGTVAANVINLGAIAPGGAGAIGTLTIDGTLDTSSGTVNTELTSGAAYDKLAATGAVTVGASTVVNRTDLAGAYASGDTFDIVQSTAAPVAGTAPAVSGFGVDKVNPSYYALRLTSQAGDNFWIRQSSGAYVSGAWEDAANWQLGLPTAAQLVHIARPDTLTVTMNGGSGPATIAGLVLGPANTLALTGNASLALGARASKLSGAISLGGGTSLTHAGNLTLESGGVLLGGGTLDVGAGTFTNKGKVSPGGSGIGTLTIKGNFEQASGGALETVVGGAGAGQSDVLAVTGNTVLDGSLSATVADGYSPETNLPIAIVTAGGARSGVFKKITLPAGYQAGYALAEGEALRVDYVPDATAYFNNAAGTMAWKDNGNWSGGKAPGTPDRVVVDAGAPVTVDSDKYTMATLTVTRGAALAFGGGSLTSRRGTTVDGVLRLSGDVTASLDTLAGGGKLALDGGALTLTGKEFAIGALAITDGKADIGKGGLTVANYTQSGGSLSGGSGAALTVSAGFTQTAGAIAGIPALDLTQAAGAMTLGNITADTLKATSAGDIVQAEGTAMSLQHLQVSAGGAVSLPQANAIAALQGTAGGAWSAQGVAVLEGALKAGGDIALGGAGLTINANVTSSGGNVTLVADEVDVLGGSTVASAGGAGNFIKVTSATASQPIKFSAQVGEDSGAGLLLYARDMAAFSTPTLVLGDAAHTGAMSFNDGGTITAPNVSGTLRFVNNGAFTRSGAETVSANGLDITAVGGIVLDGVNHVKSFAADNSGSGDIVFTNNSGASALALGALNNPAGAVTVDNTGGVSLQGPGAVTAGGKVSLTAHSPVSINADITSVGGIYVTASTGISLGAAARLTNTAAAPVNLLAQNGTLVLDPAARINSGGGTILLEARGASGAVSAPAGTVTGGALTVNSTELDDIAAQAAADAAAKAAADKAAADAAAKAAADKAAADAAAKAAADKAAADAAAKAAADKAAADAAAKAAADKAAADAAAKAAADKAAAEAAAKAAADKAAAEAAAKAAADKAAAEAAAKAAADKAAADAAAKAAADKAAADAVAKAAADKAAADAEAKAAADKAAADAAAKAAADKAAADAAAKAASDQAAAEAAAKAAADKAAADAAAKAAADKAAADAAAKAAADAAARAAAEKAADTAAKAAADEAARQAAENAAKAANASAKPQPLPQQDSKAPDTRPQEGKPPESKPQDGTQPDSRPPDGKPGDSTGQGSQQDAPSQAGPSTVASAPASAALAMAYEQQTIGGGAGSFGGDAGAAGDGKDAGKDGKGDSKAGGKAGDGKDKKPAKKMTVCK